MRSSPSSPKERPLTTSELATFDLSTVQREIYYDDRPTVIFVSTRGGGKTTAMMLRILGMVQRDEIRKGERIMICAPDYTQLMDGTMKTFDYWFGDIANLIVHKVNGNKPSRLLKGGIEVLCRSGMNPDQTRSKECRVVMLDEVAQMDMQMLELASMNLRPTGIRPKNDSRVYQLLMSTTPRGMNWLYRRFGKYVLDANNDDPDVGAYHMTIYEAHRQGVVTGEYLARAMQTYPPGSTKWKQEAEGEFVSWSGLVYRQDYKLIGPTNPLPKLTHVAGAIDVGSISPSCILVGGVDARGAFYIYKEHYEPRALLSNLVDIAGTWTREHHVRSWDVDNDLLWKMMRNGGMNAKPPNKTKNAAGFMVEYINDLTARGMYNIDPSCKGLISEKARYEYKDKTSGDEVTFLDTVKPNQDDHACFVAGTVVMTEHGDRLIERIREGDFVLTRKGFRRVKAAGMTSAAADVFEVALDNEEALRATANHPFWVEGQGWTRLDHLIPGDTMCDDAAPVRVVSVSAVPGKHPVYNITVEDTPEFFAHGVLVHNCDTERYLAKRLSSAHAAQNYGKSLEFSFG